MTITELLLLFILTIAWIAATIHRSTFLLKQFSSKLVIPAEYKKAKCILGRALVSIVEVY